MFADKPAFVRADGVEVAQDDDAPFGIGGVEVGHHAFHHLFGCAVGIGGLAEGGGFGYRHGVGVAVYGGGGAEYDAFYAGTLHFFKQNQAA